MMISAATAAPPTIHAVLEDVLAVDELPDEAGCAPVAAAKGAELTPPLPSVPAAAAT